MANTEWWIIPTAQTNDSGTPESGYEIVSGTESSIRAKYGSVARGPYPTKEAAQTAAKGEVGSGPGNIAVGSPGFRNPLDALQEVGHFVGVLVTDVTDVAMWRSVGWILLGFIIFVGGIFLWLKDKGVLPEVIPLPV